jgi:hypothetical protein
MEFSVVATRTSREATEACGRDKALAAEERTDGSAPPVAAVERLLSEVATALMGGAEQAAAALSFRLGGATVCVRGRYDDLAEPVLAVDYDLAIATDEPDRRFVQFHERVRGSESVQRLGVAGVHLAGCLRRAVRA